MARQTDSMGYSFVFRHKMLFEFVVLFPRTVIKYGISRGPDKETEEADGVRNG